MGLSDRESIPQARMRTLAASVFELSAHGRYQRKVSITLEPFKIPGGQDSSMKLHTRVHLIAKVHHKARMRTLAELSAHGQFVKFAVSLSLRYRLEKTCHNF